MKNKNDRYNHLTSDEFTALSDLEKSDYYVTLSSERSAARTVEDRLAVAEAYKALGKYKSAAHFASEITAEAEKQKADIMAEAQENKKKLIKLGAICVGVIAAVVVIALIISASGNKGKSYEKAVSLYEDGLYAEALEIFNTIQSYKDVKLYITSIDGMLKTGTVNGQRIRVGDVITLGAWYEDGDKTKPKTAIKWVVLEVDSEGKRVYAVSLDILAAMSYGKTDVWKNSDICAWLNGEFLDEAFSESELKMIDTNLYEELDETGDVLSAFSSKLALMSQDEKVKYLTDLKFIPADGAGVSQWWLRTAAGEGKIMYIAENGQLATVGEDSKTAVMGVRPVAWFNFD